MPSGVILTSAAAAVMLAVLGASGRRVSETLVPLYVGWALAVLGLGIVLVLGDKPLSRAVALLALTLAASLVALLVIAAAITAACGGGRPCPFS